MPTSVLSPTHTPNIGTKPATGAPPSVVGPKNRGPTRPTNNIPQSIIDEAQSHARVPFNPEEHLNLVPPSRFYTMKEIGLEGLGISPNAATEPFSLFTPAAIKQMRAELFSQTVLDQCQYSSDFASNMIRGFGPRLAPFIFDVWNNPEVLALISRAAGVDLIPAMEFDVGHINISVNDTTTKMISTNAAAHVEESAFAWHRDSYPFVCVTMLSDCTGMLGGETMVRTGSGETMKLRGPTMGTAVVMQGRYIEHQALKAVGGRERIAMITSFRPRNPSIRDETVLTGVRPISTLPELYGQYTQYRLEVLKERIRLQEKRIRDREHGGRRFDIAETKQFLDDQRQFLEATINELIE